MTTPVLKLRRGEDRRLRAGHLWVFSNEVDVVATPLGSFHAGMFVQVVNDREQFIGHAYVNPHALICARIVSRHQEAPIDRSLLARRIRVALRMREALYNAPYYRLLFGESDGLPGVVLDRYDDVVIGQLATAGAEALRPELEAAIEAELAPRALVWRNNGSARELEQLPKEIICGLGSMPDTLRVQEGALHFEVPLNDAQKTGWFYDQTANRALFSRFIKPGARVLDVCSYAGAWALTALAAGAGEATCVDASAAAQAVAERNAQRNGRRLTMRTGDAFDTLEQLHREGQRFDAIVLDPPAFIKRRKDAARGEAAYRKLNHLAMRLLDIDSILVSCSCSWHLPGDELVSLIQSAARQSQRFVQIVASGAQSPDHPIHPAIPETRYLKACFCRVTRD